MPTLKEQIEAVERFNRKQGAAQSPLAQIEKDKLHAAIATLRRLDHDVPENVELVVGYIEAAYSYGKTTDQTARAILRAIGGDHAG